VATPAGATSTGIRPPRPPGRVGSEEFHSGSLPTAQEAAVLFSANHAAAAIDLLKAEIKDPVGRNNKQAWLLLFDLYQVQGNRAEFDNLSMMYTVKFEQSAPSWAAEGEDSPSDPRRNTARERKDFFALKPDAAGSLGAAPGAHAAGMPVPLGLRAAEHLPAGRQRSPALRLRRGRRRRR